MLIPEVFGYIILCIPLLVLGSPILGNKSRFEINATASYPLWRRAGENIKWAALGDSFAAGPGAGEPYEGHGDEGRNCRAYDGAYPSQLQDEAFPGERLTFLACTGDVTDNVIDTQVPKLGKESGIFLVTLSIGGNDALFGPILKACVFKPKGPWSEDCEETLEKAENIIEGRLDRRIRNVYAAIDQVMPVDGIRYRPIYHTLYDNFFNADTDWCDGQTMGIIPGFKPKLTKELRSRLNQLTQRLNSVISGAARDWNWGTYDNRHQIPIPGKKTTVTVVEPNSRFDGHRFCEPKVENFGDDSIWFFKLLGDDVESAGIEDFSDIDIKTCSGNPSVQSDLQMSIRCDMAQYYAETAEAGNKNITKRAPDKVTKAFHPKTRGFTAIKDENLETMFRLGKPKNGDFKILPLGDSITWGTGSESGNGYRSALEGILKQENNELDFIGSQNSGNMADNDNEGHPGYTISQISDVIRSDDRRRSIMMDAGESPNVVLLHAGTNDLDKLTDPDTAYLRLGALIDQLFNEYPDTTVVVSELVPSSKADMMKRIKDFNVRVALEVQSRREKGQHVWFAWTPVTPKGLSDNIHPNDDGYYAMALGWAEALEEIQNKKWVKDPKPGGGRQCDGLPKWIEQGELANGAGLGQERSSGMSCEENRLDRTKCFCTWLYKDDTLMIDRGDNECSDFYVGEVNAVRFADLNSDGRDEYLWVHEDGSVTAFQNAGYKYADNKHGNIKWLPKGKVAAGVGGIREQTHFADINGDGRADYLLVHPNGSVNAWLNVLEKTNDISKIVWVEQGQIAAGIGRTGTGVRFADLNGDGRAEYLYIDSMGAVTCYLNGGYKYIDSKHGEVGWIKQGVIATGVGGWRGSLRFADINGDGRADYLDMTGDGEVMLWQNLGGKDDGPNAGKIKWWERGKIATGPGGRIYNSDITFADLTGSGRADYVLLDTQTSAATVWVNGCF